MIGRVASYELLEKIGEGGMGAVFKGRNPRLGSVVAIKVLYADLARDPEYRTRFLREAKAEASVHHHNIASCFDVDEARLEPPDLLDPGSPGPHAEQVLFLVMEYVPGGDLQELVGERPIEIPKVLDLVIQIGAGLESAHKAGVIHRDLKSTNIRVKPDGQVKIVDFGLSRIERGDLPSDAPTLTTSRERVMGTVHFMAPEQARGRTTDPRSDLFSLGVILYQLVTGRLPFTGATPYEVANAVAAEDPPPLARYASGVPDELERIVRKLIAKDPERRYQSAHEVRTDLEHLRMKLAGAKPAPPPKPTPPPKPPVGRIALAATVVVVLLVALLWPRTTAGIAVMPFENRTSDPRLDYVGDGMAASVIADLVREARLNVSSLTATRGVDADKRGAQAVARELGVGAVVEGSLHREGGITYLDVQLTDGRRGFVLWTQRFPYALKDAAATGQEIVRQVERKVRPWYGRARAGTSSAPARSPSAYDLCLRGAAFLEDPDDPQSADKALEHYARAAEVDPEFALAWAGRSRALWSIWRRDKTEEAIRRAEEAANRGIQLNPMLLEARLARAQIYRATGRHAESIHELEEVLKVNPQWNDALIHLAASYREADDMVRAVETQRRAIALQPGYWRNWDGLGTLLFRRARYDEAAAAFGKVIELLPGKNRGYENLAAVESKRGNFKAAFAAYERLPSPVTSGLLASNIGTAYYFEGRFADARRYYGLAVELDPRDPGWWANLGDLHARLGQPDSARAAYQRAVGLAGEQLQVNPNNTRLNLDRAVLLAKLGQCDAARSAVAELSGHLPEGDAECATRMAKLNAVCGRPAEAIAELHRALSLGASWPFLSKQDEFASLLDDPAFQALSRVKGP